MFKIRDPLGLIEQDPELKAQVTFIEKVVKPVCGVLIGVSLLFIATVVFIEVVFKHGG